MIYARTLAQNTTQRTLLIQASEPALNHSTDKILTPHDRPMGVRSADLTPIMVTEPVWVPI